MLFHERVIEGYQHIIKQDPTRFAVIDASQPIEAVVDASVKAILKQLAD